MQPTDPRKIDINLYKEMVQQKGLILDKFKPSDIEAVKEILFNCRENLNDYFIDQLHDSWDPDVSLKHDELITIGINNYIKQISEESYVCIVAREQPDGQVLGLITFNNSDGESTHIDVLAINPKAQGRKIAQFLIGYVVTCAANEYSNYVDATAIGNSHTFWNKHFYNDHKDFLLHQKLFLAYVNFSLTNDTFKLFPFLDNLENDEKQKSIADLLNTTKDNKFFKLLHKINYGIAINDIETHFTETIIKALGYLDIKIKDNKNEIIEEPYSKLIEYVLDVGEKIYHLNPSTLLDAADVEGVSDTLKSCLKKKGISFNEVDELDESEEDYNPTDVNFSETEYEQGPSKRRKVSLDTYSVFGKSKEVESPKKDATEEIAKNRQTSLKKGI